MNRPSAPLAALFTALATVLMAGCASSNGIGATADTHSATVWPEGNLPGTTDNFVSNDVKGLVLADGDRFFFKTFGFPVEAQVTEYVAPAEGQPGRVARHGWAGEEGSAERLDVIHAWLVEDLPGGRVRVLTQAGQKGQPAQASAASKPNIMINGHQDWLTGLVEAARKTQAQ